MRALHAAPVHDEVGVLLRLDTIKFKSGRHTKPKGIGLSLQAGARQLRNVSQLA
jgi:hypothetical protein